MIIIKLLIGVEFFFLKKKKHLDNASTCTSCHNGSGCTNVEQVVAITTSADDIDPAFKAHARSTDAATIQVQELGN